MTATRFEREADAMRRYAHRVAWAAHRRRGPEWCEDLVHEAMLRVCGAHLVVKDEWRGWLARVVHTTAMDVLQRENRRPILILGAGRTGVDGEWEAVQDYEPGPAPDIAGAVIAADTLERLLAGLSDLKRAALEGHLAGGSYAEVAEEVGVSLATARTRICRARREVARAYLAQAT